MPKSERIPTYSFSHRPVPANPGDDLGEVIYGTTSYRSRLPVSARAIESTWEKRNVSAPASFFSARHCEAHEASSISPVCLCMQRRGASLVLEKQAQHTKPDKRISHYSNTCLVHGHQLCTAYLPKRSHARTDWETIYWLAEEMNHKCPFSSPHLLMILEM